MRKIYSFKLSIKKNIQKVCLFLVLFLALAQNVYAETTYVSLIPSITELIYALKLENGLIGVSDRCNYPEGAKNKEKIGTLYGINKEKILKLKPDYIFALKTSKPFVSELEGTVKFVYFEFNSVDDIFKAINILCELLKGDYPKNSLKKRADELIFEINAAIKPEGDGRRILYVIQDKPLITIGAESYLTDVIRRSGNVSATSELGGQYPSISLEYAIKLHPDYIVVGPYADIEGLKPFFKGTKTKFVTTTSAQNDIINRPGARIGEAVMFFAELGK